MTNGITAEEIFHYRNNWGVISKEIIQVEKKNERKCSLKKKKQKKIHISRMHNGLEHIFCPDSPFHLYGIAYFHLTDFLMEQLGRMTQSAKDFSSIRIDEIT